MAFSAARAFSKITRYLPATRGILSHNCGLYRVGGNTSNTRTITRSLFFLCRNRDPLDVLGAYSVSNPASSKCSCGCSMHTQGKEIGDKELVAFLEEEIANETKSQTKSMVLPELDEFVCNYDGSDVTFFRKFNNEKISIKTNVNHSVDTEETMEDQSAQKEGGTPEEMGEMKAKPDFTVEISKGHRVLRFECSFAESIPGEGDDAYNDAFQIAEISFYEKEDQDNTYSVSGDIMDGYLYDLLMNYLEERGVSNNFVDKMGGVLTSYEHRLYVDLLQNMKKFIEK